MPFRRRGEGDKDIRALFSSHCRQIEKVEHGRGQEGNMGRVIGRQRYTSRSLRKKADHSISQMLRKLSIAAEEQLDARPVTSVPDKKKDHGEQFSRCDSSQVAVTVSCTSSAQDEMTSTDDLGASRQTKTLPIQSSAEGESSLTPEGIPDSQVEDLYFLRLNTTPRLGDSQYSRKLAVTKSFWEDALTCPQQAASRESDEKATSLHQEQSLSLSSSEVDESSAIDTVLMKPERMKYTIEPTSVDCWLGTVSQSEPESRIHPSLMNLSSEDESCVSDISTVANDRLITAVRKNRALTDDQDTHVTLKGAVAQRVRKNLAKRLIVPRAPVFSPRKRPHRSWLVAKEEARQRQEKENEVLHTVFKARSTPKSTTEPRYRQMVRQAMKQSRERRQLRKERLQDTLQPFTGMEERAKKAVADKQKIITAIRTGSQNRKSGRKRLPMTGKTMHFSLSAIGEEPTRQVNRSIDATKEIPVSVQRILSQLTAKKQKKADLEEAQQCTFQPVCCREVPDFERCKQRWASRLRAIREKRRLTQASVSHLRMFSQEAQEQERRKREKLLQKHLPQTTPGRQSQLLQVLQKAALKPSQAILTTRTERLKQAKREDDARKVALQKQKMEGHLQALEERRRNTRALVRRAVAKSEKQRREQHGLLTLAAAQRKAKVNAKRMKDEWQEMLSELKQKMEEAYHRERPLLVESAGMEAQHAKQRKKMKRRIMDIKKQA